MAERKSSKTVRRGSGGAQPRLRGLTLDDASLYIPSPLSIFDDIQATVTGVPIQPAPPSPLGGEVRESPIRPLDQPFLKSTFDLYRGACECGVAYANNCAHFLTDAMVRSGLPRPFPNAYAKCAKGRLIRAKEALEWFKTFHTAFKVNHTGIASGYWFVYQEDASGQGHVCVHLEAAGSFQYRGTGDFSSVWPVNWHYYY
jgi:hypothetical protein